MNTWLVDPNSDSHMKWKKVLGSVLCLLGSRWVLVYKAQEEAGELLRSMWVIEGPCYSTREAMWVHLVLFLSKEVGKSRMTIREDIS